MFGSAAAAQEPPLVRFRDVTADSGIEFRLEHHPSSEKHLVETMPGGLAAFDFDGDGLIDLYFTNGAAVPSLRKESPRYWNRLYKNLGGMRFRDVTEEAGVAGKGYSMGAAVADYDSDGRPDLFVASVRGGLLYRNLGDGTFEEAADAAGIVVDGWIAAAGWFDFDRDGWLDLFVVRYLDWSADDGRFCGDRSANLRVYCHPRYFAGLTNKLFRNRGDGTFEDVSAQAGLDDFAGKGMSLGIADFDQDGWPDVFVTNDAVPNFLFRNLGGGAFEETALFSGVALPDSGKPVSSMGAAVGDYDNDGLPDILVTALATETFPLFRNLGGGAFEDRTAASRLAALSHARSGWGVCMADFDNDGWKDIFTATSHVNDRIADFQALPYRQPDSVFRNAGGEFQEASGTAGEAFEADTASRGAICVDLDGDGKLDAVVTALGEPARILQNVSPGVAAWVGLKLAGAGPNRDAIGAAVRVAGQTGFAGTATGYASSVAAPLHFGLGNTREEPAVEVLWPDGSQQRISAVPLNRVTEIRQPVQREEP